MSFTVKIQQGTAATRRGEFLPVKQVKPFKKLNEASKQFNVWVQMSLGAALPTYVILYDELDRITLAEFQIKPELAAVNSLAATPEPKITPTEPTTVTRSAFGVGKRDKPVAKPTPATKPKRRLL